MKQYLELLEAIKKDGYYTGDRTGVGTQALPGYSYLINLDRDEAGIIHNFPLLTTKKVFLRGTFEELIWKLRGETNIRSLVEKNVHIWSEWPFKKYLESTGELHKFPWYVDEEKSDYTDEWKQRLKDFEERIVRYPSFAKQWGELGPTYGHHMRNFGEVLGSQISDEFRIRAGEAALLIENNDVIVEGVDQLAKVLNAIRNNPTDRRIIMTLWNPHDNAHTLLPPCPCFYQFFANQDGYLHLNVYQRSCDTFLGVPFNDSQDALLLILLALATGRKPGRFFHIFGDVHIYNNHRKQVDLQLSREPRSLPSLKIKTVRENPTDYVWEDLELIGYDPHPVIKAPVAV
ncbi:MAG: thymidylate synthase [Candidatus Peribacteria bacterium]|jgi:thymidylate synthase|nr:thymidylate synthase [Candidatus Peribacteria bacterium]